MHKEKCWSNKSASTMTWSNAISYCTGLGGRLPNIQELRMLIKECPQNEYPKPDGQEDWCTIEDPGNLGGSYCRGCASDSSGKYSVFGHTGWFWSSSVYFYDTDIAWNVNFSNGNLNYDYKTSIGYAMCER